MINRFVDYFTHVEYVIIINKSQIFSSVIIDKRRNVLL